MHMCLSELNSLLRGDKEQLGKGEGGEGGGERQKELVHMCTYMYMY